MQTFLVLGQIPGTNIQITFRFWLDTLEAVIICLLLLRTLHFLRRNRHAAELFAARVPLPASQLHQRVQ